jgi:xylose isomerase
MSFDSVSQTLLGIEKIGPSNAGLLLDFGYAPFGGESPADSAKLALHCGPLVEMDVTYNFRFWETT